MTKNRDAQPKISRLPVSPDHDYQEPYEYPSEAVNAYFEGDETAAHRDPSGHWQAGPAPKPE